MPVAACVLAGAALGLSWQPFNLWPLGFLALWPVFWLLDRRPGGFRTALLYGLATGLSADVFLQGWLVPTFREHLGLAAAVPAFVAFSALTSLNWVLFYWLAMRRRDRLSWIAAWAVAQTVGWELFPHQGLNHVTGDLAFVQIAGLVGVAGGSLVWFWTSLSLHDLFQGRRAPLALAGAAAFLLAHAYGLAVLAAPAPAPTARVAVVQPGPQRWRSLDSMEEQTRRALQANADVVIWPEGSLPESPSLEGQGVTLLAHFARREGGGLYNVMALVDPPGSEVASYRKRELTPVGETVPLIADWLPWRPRFAAGTEPGLLPTPLGPVLPLLCYEAIVPDFAWRSFRATGGRAVLLVNSASDAWSHRSGAALHHFDLARMRAIELGIPLIRAARTGPSAAVDPQGRVTGQTAIHRRDFAVYDVAPRPANTVYALLGPFPWYAVLLLAVGRLLWRDRPRRLESTANP